MGSRLSKFKQNVGSPMIMLRTKRRSTHRPSLSHDTALTQIDPTLESQTARPFKIRSKKRRRSDTMPTDMSRSSRSYDTSRRISQLTTRTSVTSPGTVVPRRSTPEELAEADRFDQQHYFLQLVTGLTMHVPIEQPRSCLDLATGTGIWVLETSSNFPNCEFLGVDIDSRSLPRDLMPTNCRFEQVDISKNLPFTNDSFDYIRHHWLPLGTVPLSGTSCQSVRKRSSQSVTLERKLSRSSSTRLNTAPSTDWELHLGRCYNICSPGGWLELMGTDAHIHSGSFIAYRFNKWMDRVEQRRRVHLRRRSGSKDKHTSGSFARYSVNSAQQPWSALPTPSTTGSGGSTTSAPAMRSSLPSTAFPILSAPIASSELPSAVGPNPQSANTESAASSKVILQMLECGWRDVRHRNWLVPLSGTSAMGVASWRYLKNLVASRRDELVAVIREELQKSEINVNNITTAAAPVHTASDYPTPLPLRSSLYETPLTNSGRTKISRRPSHVPAINTQNMPIITTTETASPLPMSYHSNDTDDNDINNPLTYGLPPTPFTTLTTATPKQPNSGTSVKSMMHLGVVFMERARLRLLGSDSIASTNEEAEQELDRLMEALEQEVIACQAYIILTVIIGRKRSREQ